MAQDVSSASRIETIVLDGQHEAYVMSNPALERLLFDRNLIGLEFTRACQESSEAFVRHFREELEQSGEDLAELVVLSKGIYYWMHNAYATTTGRNLEANFIATKRVAIEGTSVTIEVPYSDFSAPAHTLIVADTVASGATLIAALRHYLEFYPLSRLFVFSIAGSRIGGSAIATFCRNHNIKLTMVYGLAAFGLAANGFDLSFLHPDTICPNQEYVRRASEVFDGRPVSVVGWDFGSQAQATRKYKMLCWIEAEYWGLQSSKVFTLKEPVADADLVKKEAAAYRDRVHLT